MNINRKLCTKIALVLLGFSPILWNTNSAHAVTGSLSIDNEDFSITAGTGLNNADGNSTIDNTAISDGFGDQFSNTSNSFLLLGATDPTATINGTPTNSIQSTVNTTAQSTTFEIDSDNIANGLNLNFDWAFQGTNDTFDSFFVAIVNSDFSVFETVLTQPTYNVGTFNQNIDVSSLDSDTDYSLFVSLTESPALGNSAAGFDNIAVSSVSVPVPFEFSPSLGLLMIGGLFGGHTYLKRRKSAANINFD